MAETPKENEIEITDAMIEAADGWTVSGLDLNSQRADAYVRIFEAMAGACPALSSVKIVDKRGPAWG